MEQIPLFMSKPLEEVDPDENPAAAAFQCIKLEEETPEGIRICICVFMLVRVNTCACVHVGGETICGTMRIFVIIMMLMCTFPQS